MNVYAQYVFRKTASSLKPRDKLFKSAFERMTFINEDVQWIYPFKLPLVSHKIVAVWRVSFFNTHTAMGSKESKTGTDIVIYSAEPIFERRPKFIRKYIADSTEYSINYLRVLAPTKFRTESGEKPTSAEN